MANRKIKCMYLKEDKCMFLGNCSHDNCKHYKKNQEMNNNANKDYYVNNNGKKTWI